MIGMIPFFIKGESTFFTSWLVRLDNKLASVKQASVMMPASPPVKLLTGIFCSFRLPYNNSFDSLSPNDNIWSLDFGVNSFK